jgi:hypothetical protein
MAIVTFFKDLPLDFTPHPVSGDIRPVINDIAVKRSILNIMKTAKGSRPFYPEFGCSINSFLFSNRDPFAEDSIKDMINDALLKFEPRIDVLRVQVIYDQSNNDTEVYIKVEYRIKNTNLSSSVTTSITKV